MVITQFSFKEHKKSEDKLIILIQIINKVAHYKINIFNEIYSKEGFREKSREF